MPSSMFSVKNNNLSPLPPKKEVIHCFSLVENQRFSAFSAILNGYAPFSVCRRIDCRIEYAAKLSGTPCVSRFYHKVLINKNIRLPKKKRQMLYVVLFEILFLCGGKRCFESACCLSRHVPPWEIHVESVKQTLIHIHLCLTARGQSLMPHVSALIGWALEHFEEITK